MWVLYRKLRSVIKVLRPIPPLPMSMLCGCVTVFGWTVLVIQVACTSDTKLSSGRGHKNSSIYIILLTGFHQVSIHFLTDCQKNPKKVGIWSSQFLGFLLVVSSCLTKFCKVEESNALFDCPFVRRIGRGYWNI